MPINLGTINQFFRTALGPDEARASSREQAAEVGAEASAEPRGEGDLADRAAAVRGVHPGLHRQAVADRSDRAARPTMITRLPVRYTYDNRYFNDTYEGLPIDGYTAWLERMADHPRIEVRLSTDFLDEDARRSRSRATVGRLPVVYTGPIDRYFDDAEGGAVVAHARLRAGGAARRRLPGDLGDELRRRRRAVHAGPRVPALPPRAGRTRATGR